MLKRALFIISCGIISLMLLIQWQKQNMLEQIQQQFANQHIQAEQIELSLFPTPTLIAHNINYPMANIADLNSNLSNTDFPSEPKLGGIFFQVFQLKLNPLTALIGKFYLTELTGKNGAFWLENKLEPEFSQLQLQLTPVSSLDLTEITPQNLFNQQLEIHIQGQDRQQNKLSLSSLTNFDLTNRQLNLKATQAKLDLANPLFQQKQINVAFQQGNLLFKQANVDFQFENIQLNQQQFPLWLGNFEQANNLKQLSLFLNPQKTQQLKTSLVLPRSFADPFQVNLETQQFPASSLWALLNFPTLIEGSTNLSATLELENHQLKGLKANLSVQNGKLNSINLMDLLSQYFPINYNSEQSMQTEFAEFSAQLNWQNNQLNWDNVKLISKHLTLTGEGKMDLDSQQCDLKINLSPQQKEYAQLSLPIHFFNHCASPSYKVEMNSSFREQLKTLLKEKLK